MEIEKTNRLANFELIRVIAIIFVVISHYAQHGILPIYENSISIIRYVAMCLQSLGMIGVVLFVLLTGYFMIEKKNSIKHFSRIVFETLFYSWGIFIIFAYFLKSFIIVTPEITYKSFFPITSGHYWFITSYLILYLFIPIFNKMFNLLKKQALKSFIIFSCVAWFVVPLLCNYQFELTGSNIGFLCLYFIWAFSCLYFIGAYAKKYDLVLFKKRRIALLTLFLSEGIICMLQFVFLLNNFSSGDNYMRTSWCSSIFSALVAVSIFYLFKNYKVKHPSIITFFASSTFAIYLITENICIRQIIWDNIFHCNLFGNLLYMLFNLILAVFISCLACIVIDKTRIILFERPILQTIEYLFNKILIIKKEKDS